MIFFTAGYAVSIIPSGECVFIHDSHNRNEQGMPDPVGNAILLKFHSLLDAVRYLHDLYAQLTSNEREQYEIVCVSVKLSNDNSQRKRYIGKQRVASLRKKKAKHQMF